MNDGSALREKISELEVDAAAKSIAPDDPRKTPVRRTREIELDILERMCNGETPLAITRSPGMPTFRSVRTWAQDDPEGFGAEFERAREVMLYRLADETLEIADNSTNDWVERNAKDGSTYVALNVEAVQRSKIRIDTRRWYLAMMSAKFQEQTNVNVKGAIAVAHITDRDRATKIAQIMGKAIARERALEDDLAPAIEHPDELA